MRYELDGPNLLVMRDSPYLRTYKVDFVSATRNVKMQSQSSTQFSAAAAPPAEALRPTPLARLPPSTSPPTASCGNRWCRTSRTSCRKPTRCCPRDRRQPRPRRRRRRAGRRGTSRARPIARPPLSSATARAGCCSSARHRASTRRSRSSSTSVLNSVRRQVLIEATVAEVQLNNEYQRGIDWQRLRTGATGVGVPGFGTGQSGVEFLQQSAGTPAGVEYQRLRAGRRGEQPQPERRHQAARVLRQRARALQPQDQRAQQPDRAAARHARHRVLHDHALDCAGDHHRRRRRAGCADCVHHHAERRRRRFHDERAAADQRDRRHRAQRAADDPPAGGLRHRPQPGAGR